VHPEAVLISAHNAGLLGPDFADLGPVLDAVAPCAAIVNGGSAVAVCFSSRLAPRAAEAGVETLAPWRRRGHAAGGVAPLALPRPQPLGSRRAPRGARGERGLRPRGGGLLAVRSPAARLSPRRAAPPVPRAAILSLHARLPGTVGPGPAPPEAAGAAGRGILA